MITAQEMLNHLTAEPFEPFRIHTASGRDFDIRHPEFAQVGRSSLTIFTSPAGDPDGPQQWVKVSLMLVESIAPLDGAGRERTGTDGEESDL